MGTTLTQWDALRAIERQPGASAHSLAVATFQTDQAFGTLANRLEAQGLIQRRPGYGRRIEHHLTPAGKTTLEAGQTIASDVLRASFVNLTEEERSTLLAQSPRDYSRGARARRIIARSVTLVWLYA